MDNILYVLPGPNDTQRIKEAFEIMRVNQKLEQPSLLVWAGFEEFVKKGDWAPFSQMTESRIFGLLDGDKDVTPIMEGHNFSEIRLFCLPEKIMGVEAWNMVKSKSKTKTYVFEDNVNPEDIRFVSDTYVLFRESDLKRLIHAIPDFEMADGSSQVGSGKSVGKTGMLVTFYRTNYNTYDQLRGLLKTLTFTEHFVVLASHSPVPEDIQGLCDLFVYESENIADQRKWSHGVAETSLIRKGLSVMKEAGLEWTFKLCYDTELIDPDYIGKWKNSFRYKFVSLQWGACPVSTNAFFGNIDFILSNFSFFNSIEEMFTRSTFIEDVWRQDVIVKNLIGDIYTYASKEEMFGPNRVDTKSFSYTDIVFRYDPEQDLFHVDNFSDTPLSGRFSIVDYYTDLAFYVGNLSVENASLWIRPNEIHRNQILPRNGCYLEVTDESGHLILRKNLDIRDYGFKHPFSKVHNTIRKEMLLYCSDAKYAETVSFHRLEMYSQFKFRQRGIKTFIDAGAHAGLFTLALLEAGAKKGYMIEPEPNAYKCLLKAFDSERLRVFDKALFSNDGEATLNIFSQWQTTNSLNPNWQPEIKNTVQVETISVDSFFNRFVEEEVIDLFKIDIEGAEYDAFSTMSDENTTRVRNFLIEFHDNRDSKVLQIVEKLKRNGFNLEFDKYSPNDSDDVLSNTLGTIFAWR